MADSAITSPALVTDGVLTEKCDAVDATCDDNAKQFKGVFVRYFMDLNEDRATKRSSTSRRRGCGQRRSPEGVRLADQASALSVLIAAVPKD
ncbi:hypothetical protein V6K52_00850 [Knoellia sp. S7-12]|uniref:hypothetical protein n=1 Tax=Knoellia sp. S7-12 TaxID=3126698 RepID=UPI0033699D97